jgi:radical SAM protein with 4Fe4S-binding SPASM domain
LRASGAHTLGLSLEGATPTSHDGFHEYPGSFESTLRACDQAHRLGLRVQLATLAGPANLAELGRILQHVKNHEVRSWTVTFPGGRAVSAVECELVLHFLARAGQRVGVATSEAHHFQRVQRLRAECWSSGVCPEDGLLVDGLRLGQHALYRKLVDNLPAERPRITRGALPALPAPGSASLFIDAQGDVRPCSWLPLSAGNVRTQELASIYRASRLFGRLRDPAHVTGRCGRCEFREVCAPSWPRSLEATGSVHGEDPLCGYEPGAYRRADGRAVDPGQCCSASGPRRMSPCKRMKQSPIEPR